MSSTKMMKLHNIKNKYYIYIYQEDDILIPYTTLLNWSKNVKLLWKNKTYRNYLLLVKMRFPGSFVV